MCLDYVIKSVQNETKYLETTLDKLLTWKPYFQTRLYIFHPFLKSTLNI